MQSFFKYIMAAVLVLMCMLSIEAKVYVVSAGVADYPGTENDLRLAAADARAFSSLFSSNGNSHTVTLTDRKATTSEVLGAIKKQFAKAGPSDQVIFFFSGHGIPGCIQCYDGALTFGKIAKAMSGSKAGSKMVFLDACHSGTIRQGNKKPDNSVKKKNIMFFLSCRDDEYSVEYAGARNGVYTECLVEALSGKADRNSDRTITARELFDYVNPTAARKSRQEQHPVMWGNFATDMPVIKW